MATAAQCPVSAAPSPAPSSSVPRTTKRCAFGTPGGWTSPCVSAPVGHHRADGCVCAQEGVRVCQQTRWTALRLWMSTDVHVRNAFCVFLGVHVVGLTEQNGKRAVKDDRSHRPDSGACYGCGYGGKNDLTAVLCCRNVLPSRHRCRRRRRVVKCLWLGVSSGHWRP